MVIVSAGLSRRKRTSTATPRTRASLQRFRGGRMARIYRCTCHSTLWMLHGSATRLPSPLLSLEKHLKRSPPLSMLATGELMLTPIASGEPLCKLPPNFFLFSYFFFFFWYSCAVGLQVAAYLSGRVEVLMEDCILIKVLLPGISADAERLLLRYCIGERFDSWREECREIEKGGEDMQCAPEKIPPDKKSCFLCWCLDEWHISESFMILFLLPTGREKARAVLNVMRQCTGGFEGNFLEGAKHALLRQMLWPLEATCLELFSRTPEKGSS